MDANQYKAQFRDLFDKVSASPDPMAELTRLQQFVGNRDHEAMAQQAGQLHQQNAELVQANQKLAKGARTSKQVIKALAAASVAFGLVSAGEYLRGPTVVTLDSSASTDLIQASASDADMLSQVFRTDAKYFTPMEIVAPDGAVVHPEIPSTVASSVIARGSCVYAFGTRLTSADGSEYAQVVMRMNGVTSKGYISARRLQEKRVEMHEAQPCKATPKGP